MSVPCPSAGVRGAGRAAHGTGVEPVPAAPLAAEPCPVLREARARGSPSEKRAARVPVPTSTHRRLLGTAAINHLVNIFCFIT